MTMEAGKYEEAGEFARQAIGHAERLGNETVLGHTLALLAGGELRQGKLEQAREHAERAVRVLGRQPPSDSLVYARSYLTEVYTGQGEAALAQDGVPGRDPARRVDRDEVVGRSDGDRSSSRRSIPSRRRGRWARPRSSGGPVTGRAGGRGIEPPSRQWRFYSWSRGRGGTMGRYMCDSPPTVGAENGYLKVPTAGRITSGCKSTRIHTGRCVPI